MAYNIHHPSSVLAEKLTTALRTLAPDAEQMGMLHQAQLNIIYEHQWFKLFVPAELGGRALSLPEALKLEEALSWIDGSLGWVVTLCAGAGWFIGFIPQSITDSFFKNENLCIAGSGAINGYADLIENGFVLNGLWPYASGALHATAFTANCFIRKNNKQVYHADGTPQVAAFILESNEVTLKKTWKTMGMLATGSHAFEVADLMVPMNRSFIIDADHLVLNTPVYQYPFLQLAETTLAVNMSGMACRFIELIEYDIAQKDLKSSTADLKRECTLQEVRDTINQSRKVFFETVIASWEILEAKKLIQPDLLNDISRVSQDLVQAAKASINTLYPYGGLKAATADTEMNRIWRNFYTASQHALFNK
jgi:indole-3-acetate monooxygenase